MATDWAAKELALRQRRHYWDEIQDAADEDSYRDSLLEDLQTRITDAFRAIHGREFEFSAYWYIRKYELSITKLLELREAVRRTYTRRMAQVMLPPLAVS